MSFFRSMKRTQDRKKAKTVKQIQKRPPMGFEALEPRLLLSGDGFGGDQQQTPIPLFN